MHTSCFSDSLTQCNDGAQEDVNLSGKKAKRVNVRPQVPQVPVGLAEVAVQQYEELEAAKK